MGEFAEYKGSRIQIGTCEDLFYLRADQWDHVTPISGRDDVTQYLKAVRFRFPWPDEDEVEPGMFKDYDRSCALRGLEAPAEHAEDHHSVGFVAAAGYQCSLPCPESGKAIEGAQVQRTSFRGAVHLCQQRWWNGLLVGVLECGGCGLAWRLETLIAAQPAIDALRSEAEQQQQKSAVSAEWYATVAERLRAGYDRA
jgi:hypothetical protein